MFIGCGEDWELGVLVSRIVEPDAEAGVEAHAGEREGCDAAWFEELKRDEWAFGIPAFNYDCKGKADESRYLDRSVKILYRSRNCMACSYKRPQERSRAVSILWPDCQAIANQYEPSNNERRAEVIHTQLPIADVGLTSGYGDVCNGRRDRGDDATCEEVPP